MRGDVLDQPEELMPNLSALIRGEGVSFRNAFCQNPVCTPSRCSFMTGWYPHVRGHRTMYHMLQPDEPMLLKTLKDNGYYVWWGGKNDLLPGQNSWKNYVNKKHKLSGKEKPELCADQKSWRASPGSRDYYSNFAGKIDVPEGCFYEDRDWEHVRSCVSWIENEADSKSPFCLYLPLQYPHSPYGVEEPWFSLVDRGRLENCYPAPENWSGKPSMLQGIYRRQNLSHWTAEQWKELKAVYLGMCSRIDYQFGMVLQALKDRGLYDNTAVFFFSDHGDFAGNYGLVEKTQNTFEDSLTRVPLVIKPPAGYDVNPGGRGALVELVDFTATVEDLLNLVPSYTHFGRTLLPLLAQDSEHRDAVFCEGGRCHGERHCMELESTSSSNKSGLLWPRVNLEKSEGPEHTKAVMVRTKTHKYVHRLYEQDELYDLKKDPMELNNVADRPEYRQLRSEMEKRLLRFFMETADVVPHTPDKRGFDD